MMMLNDNLTEHEMNILKLLAKGYSNSLIASTVYISKSTLTRNLRSIAEKLGESGRENILRQSLINELIHVSDLRRSPNERVH